MGKTLIFSDVDYSENAIAKSDILPTITLNNAALKAMVTSATTGKYVNSSGNITSNSNLSYIVVELSRQYKRIAISGHTGSTTGGFFSSANPSSSTRISTISQSVSGETNISNQSHNVPSGAKYLVFNLWNSYSNYSLTMYAE